MSACAALTSLLLPLAPGASVGDACLGVGLDLAGRFERSQPAAALPERFVLPRSNLELGLSRGGVGGRLVTNAVRAGGETGYVGIDGESVVVRVQVAEARYVAPGIGLAVMAGMVDDPWVVPGNDAWQLRAQGPMLAEAQGWLEPADLGGTLAWTSPGDWLSFSATLSGGEGYRRRERNGGQDLAGALTLRPLSGLDGESDLSVLIYARDGSRGLGAARDHRLGARAAGAVGPVMGGVEAMKAWGLDADASRQPRGGSAFVQGAFLGHGLAFGRFDGVDEQADLDADHLQRALVGLAFAPVLGEGSAPPPARLSLALQDTRREANARTIAGSPALARETTVWVQLDLRAREAVFLSEPLDYP